MARHSGLHEGVWVLVCDGRKALLLENRGDSVYPKLETRGAFEHADPASRDLGSDAPGRLQDGSNGRSSAIEPVDLHALAEEHFLKDIALRLDREVAAGRIGRLILVAPARALGTLRQALSPAVRAKLESEIDKDYVRMPVYEIEKQLTAHFAAHR